MGAAASAGAPAVSNREDGNATGIHNGTMIDACVRRDHTGELDINSWRAATVARARADGLYDVTFDANGAEHFGLRANQLRARAYYSEEELPFMPAPRGVTLAEKMPTLARLLPKALTRSIDESMMENRYGPPYTRKPEINEMMLEEINSHRASWREVHQYLTSFADPNFARPDDARGNTSIHLAARFGHLVIARMLLRAGARVDARNTCGATRRDARRHGSPGGRVVGRGRVRT